MNAHALTDSQLAALRAVVADAGLPNVISGLAWLAVRMDGRSARTRSQIANALIAAENTARGF